MHNILAKHGWKKAFGDYQHDKHPGIISIDKEGWEHFSNKESISGHNRFLKQGSKTELEHPKTSLDSYLKGLGQSQHSETDWESIVARGPLKQFQRK